MLEKVTTLDQIEANFTGENPTLFVKISTRILENGEELSRKVHRASFTRGSDVSDQDPRVISAFNLLFPPE